MSESLVTRKQRRTKVKTGCATCRVRKIKCDENKPSCRKCVDTGRTCDGYDSPFRIFTSQSISIARASVAAGADTGTAVILPGAGLKSIRPTFKLEFTQQDIDLLDHHFSTKTLFNVRLGCYEEARQVLQASLTDPPIRHAVSSLRALRHHLEATGDVAFSIAKHHAPSQHHDFGLQQYCLALGGLASNLSSPGSNGLKKSALLCCLIFISIEQIRGNYATMIQHIIQGLNIMHDYRSKPNAVPEDTPLLDVFVIKLYAAPCRFAEPPPSPPAHADATATTTDVKVAHTAVVCSTTTPLSPHQQTVIEYRNLRALAPNKRSELTRLAASTIDFLNKTSNAKSPSHVLQLRSEKKSLVHSLESWLKELELARQSDMKPVRPEPVPLYFMRLFHQILKIVVVGALESSPEVRAQLRVENDRLQNMAIVTDEKVRKAYGVRSSEV